MIQMLNKFSVLLPEAITQTICKGNCFPWYMLGCIQGRVHTLELGNTSWVLVMQQAGGSLADDWFEADFFILSGASKSFSRRTLKKR